MSFESMTPQSPMNPGADGYAAIALRLSKFASLRTRYAPDIAYGPGAFQKLDIYLPLEAPPSPAPVFINMHGGGNTHGYKEWMGLNAPALVTLPAIYVSVDYGLAPQTMYPGDVNDCLMALAWVWKNIAAYGGDPNRIHVGGHSAGARLCAMVTLRTDLYAAHGLPRGVVKSCFPVSGRFNLQPDPTVPPELAEPTNIPYLADPAQAREASPVAYVAGNTTPFFVTWGELDTPPRREAGRRFVEALQAQPGRVESHEFETLDHYWMHLSQMRPDSLWTRKLREWMA